MFSAYEAGDFPFVSSGKILKLWDTDNWVVNSWKCVFGCAFLFFWEDLFADASIALSFNILDFKVRYNQENWESSPCREGSQFRWAGEPFWAHQLCLVQCSICIALLWQVPCCSWAWDSRILQFSVCFFSVKQHLQWNCGFAYPEVWVSMKNWKQS